MSIYSSSPLHFARTPNSSRFSSNSPQQQTDQILHIRSLEREIKSLREERNAIGREKDRADDQCRLKDAEIIRLRQDNQSLDDRIARLRPQAERVPGMEDQIIQLQSDINQLGSELKSNKARLGDVEAQRGRIIFERDEALQMLSHKVNENEQLHQDLAAIEKRANDEREMHEQTRMKYLTLEDMYNKDSAEYKTKIRDMDSVLQEMYSEVAYHRESKKQELADQYQMVIECKERSEENIEIAKRESEAAKEELRSVTATLQELSAIADEQKDYISDLQRTCKQKDDQKAAEMEQLESKRQKEVMDLRLQCSELNRAHLDEIQRIMKAASDKSVEETRKRDIAHNEAIGKLQEHIQTLSSEKDRLQHLLRQLEANIEELQRELASKVDIIRDLQSQAQNRQNESVEFQRPKAMPVPNGTCKKIDRTHSIRATFFLDQPSLRPSSSTTGEGSNNDERVRELRERNQKTLPHMRSSYMPEVANMKNADDVLP